MEEIESVDELMEMIRRCQEMKKSRATALNDNSSRSHVLFILYLEQMSGDQVIKSKFSMVDLAGNERMDKSSNNNSSTNATSSNNSHSNSQSHSNTHTNLT